ncbi:cell division control protein 48 CDC48 [Actinoplanes capillaceus]|uniref:Cell division control protein 48 CDC48 n=1 Tax=Actinoplanes campanulatus TaxID=113559 RepID=A0ABQ3WWY7_9ACTN|nr:cell division control protein 48 CDC48 [Actinoplanes capillaceus]
MINSLAAAVEARPDDLTLRLHLAEMLVAAGRGPEAIGHAAQILAREPGNTGAQQVMARALGETAPPAPPAGGEQAPPTATVAPEAGAQPPEAATERPATGGSKIDWAAMEEQFGDVVPPRFARADGEPDPVRGHADRAFDVERSVVTLADVGGMAEVKKRLEVSFLGPLRNPKLRSLFGKSLRGGLLLYGPPGCGKTFLARAVAGEMGAAFISLSITDVLNMWIGSSERNLHDLFESARGHAPCVLFLDEIDALGHKRSQLQSSMRTVVNQLLTELDGVDGGNDGVFVLAATNAPWDVDAALRRPGRLDRTVLVLPPDRPAREAILEYHLRDRPVVGIDLAAVAAATEHYSGADLAHLCETAAEYAMRDSIATGEVRMISQADMLGAAREVRPSTDAWFATARNVAMFANESGEYDDLAAYLKKRKIR